MTELGDVFLYLEIQVNHVIGKKIIPSQSIYFKKVLERLKMTEYKPTSNPMDPKVINSLPLNDENTHKKLSNSKLNLLCGWLYILAKISPIQ